MKRGFHHSKLLGRNPGRYYDHLVASKSDIRRRGLGAIFLAASLGMLIAGQTFLRDRINPAGFLIFWMICFLFACLAILVAFVDAWIIRRRSREEARALFEQTLREIARRKKSAQETPPGQEGPSRNSPE